MKHKTLWEPVFGTVFGTLLGLGAVGCLVSAFGFAVSMWAVGVCCLLAAFLRSLPRGGYLAGIALAAVTVWLLLSGDLIRSVEGLLFRLTEIYNLGYGWKVLRWSDLPAETLDAALPTVLYLLGSLIALCAAGAVMGKSGIFALVLSLVTLGACFVVTDKVPAAPWVVLVFFAGAMLLLTGLVRKQDREQAVRLTALAAVPVLLCVLLLFAFVPRKGYDGAARATRWADAIVELWDRLWGNTAGASGSDSVDLTDVGRQSYFDSEVLQVTAKVDGKLYLRGRALDTYDGKSWTDSGTDLKLPWPDDSYLELIGEVEITSKYAHRMLYLPYYTQSLDMNQYPAGKINEHKLSRYSVTCARLPDEGLLQAYYPDPYGMLHVLGIDAGDFTDLPADTKRWARQKAEEITGGKISWYHIAKDIEAYVEQSATYDLKTDRMPLGRNDFARWFLEDGETGYCVHFATAAAVLLRAVGIPARYVTGYMVDVKAGESAVVTDADAHAWVEYWLPPFGWVVLEATPATVVPSVDTTETRPVTEPTQVHTEKDEAEEPEETPWKVPAFVWWVLGAFGFAAAALAQRKLRLALWHRRKDRGGRNQRLLYRWVRLERCCRYLKAPADAASFALAEKAKFSQYTVTKEELAVLDGALENAVAGLRKKNVFLQVYYTVILALY